MSSARLDLSVTETHADDPVPFMRTVLSDFCESFQREVRPILEPLAHAAEALAAAPEDLSARRVLPTLRDLHHQMESLVDKVTEQQGYVLIFGPLKSGKSTFMNALSAAYVSEVTSLPAYPCMVYVSHSDTPGFVVTHYNGRTSSFTQREALGEVVTSGHHELTRRIREVEAEGESFDPAVHMPDAIRRIDVKIDIEDLAQSGAVLVDTPGLYTRMKFGYERMTREFRNSAACAIFIVKTDNLFLEQVFDEFGELLELFSRIFLIVNVDSTKNDLKPDGHLAPSLEQRNPWEILEAFENLSMTTPLKKAVEDGRLEIYPVDLLRAASQRILARTGNESEFETGEAHGPAEFNDVLRDLTEFLNSNEYLKAFVNDSLRRSRTLADELGAALEDDAVQQLDTDFAALQETLDRAQTQAEIVQRLGQIQWRQHVCEFGTGVVDGARQLAALAKGDAEGSIETAVEEWFESSTSLHDLLEDRLHPIFAATHAQLVHDAEETLKRRACEDFEGLASPDDLIEDLAAVGIDLRSTADAALAELKGRAAAASPRPQLSSSDIPVRRSPSDWLLLRSGAKVRRRVFGPAERPDAEVPAQVKARVLGDRGRAAIRDVAVRKLDALLETTTDDLPELLVRGYAERFEQEIKDQLVEAGTKANATLEEAGRRLNQMQSARDALYGVAGELGPVSVSVDSLIERFGHREADTETATEASERAG